MISKTMISKTQVSSSSPTFFINLFIVIAILFFTEMLGPEDEGKISHVTEIEVSERSTGYKEEEGPPVVKVPYIKLFKDQLALNKPKKGKKGKGKGKKKKKK
jgi:hypothetical protein|tara:strand:- start:116 stop:421 length:306 start_codon:yes stop_codon:yes gene_type:complete